MILTISVSLICVIVIITMIELYVKNEVACLYILSRQVNMSKRDIAIKKLECMADKFCIKQGINVSYYTRKIPNNEDCAGTWSITQNNIEKIRLLKSKDKGTEVFTYLHEVGHAIGYRLKLNRKSHDEEEYFAKQVMLGFIKRLSKEEKLSMSSYGTSFCACKTFSEYAEKTGLIYDLNKKEKAYLKIYLNEYEEI